jgi:hypothetical protein
VAKKSNTKLVQIGAAVVAVVVAAGFALHARQEARKAAADMAATWMITGQACPVAASDADLPPLPKTMDLEEVHIAREVGGAVACNTIKENGVGPELAICQFITPGALRVATPKGVYRFTPPHGVDSSIILREQVPSCVQHINPALFNLPSAPG